MTDNEELVPLAGSERRPLRDARVIGSPDPDEETSVTAKELQSIPWLYDLLLMRKQADLAPSLCELLLTPTSV